MPGQSQHAILCLEELLMSVRWRVGLSMLLESFPHIRNLGGKVLCNVQAVLERSLASKAGQQCGLLWRAALGFELSRGRPEAARKVFLRGIHACPWSKVSLTCCHSSFTILALSFTLPWDVK